MNRNNAIQKCVLVGTVLPGTDQQKIKEYLDELEFLALTANLKTEKKFYQKIASPNPKTFIGEGKLKEIKQYIDLNNITYVIFDDELSGSQIKNIENILGCRVLDRTNLILDIFAMRAKTAYAKVQVELAQYEYLLPRLVHMWTHLERQRGGIGLRGPGEKALEADRRYIKKRISLLKEQLKVIDRQMKTQRKKREGLVRVSLVGYTNVGKSTLMNLIAKANVFAENKLFATLDTTVRKVHYNGVTFLMSDTIGFIRKLPHSLIESFKSTLDEIREADLILHVIDISSSYYEQQIEIVNNTLCELGISDKPIINVYNKFDLFVEKNKSLYPDELNMLISNFNKNPDSVVISATKKFNYDILLDKIISKVKEIYSKRYPFNISQNQ
ncbi:MAG: GTPase HflX [Bacteroidales bacterium]|nr:GTPase HflX [Bacteroidales bacterium]